MHQVATSAPFPAAFSTSHSPKIATNLDGLDRRARLSNSKPSKSPTSHGSSNRISQRLRDFMVVGLRRISWALIASRRTIPLPSIEAHGQLLTDQVQARSVPVSLVRLKSQQ